MYYTEDLFDDSLLIEDLLDDGIFDEDYYEDDLLDDDLLDDDFGEDFAERRRRGRRGRRFKRLSPKISRNVRQRSNFGKAVAGNSKNLVTKADLKVALNTISKDVNGLKRTAISNGKTLKAVDGKYSSIVKDIARKDANQTKVLKNMQTMSMLGSLLNKPKFNEENLELTVVEKENGPDEVTVKEKENDKTVNFDQTLSLLLPMLSTQGDSGSGKSSNDMMLPLVLIMSQQNNGSGSSSDSSNLMLPLVLMMMNK
ncbi:hypothetical protein MBM09_00295 [Flaviramulus sp. BrNp1-15]|uniref:hypothetical protein n=1 Tax=Flaviramulus sp. BrNp1-15 TaxID=2916754 RepID=UPI001EE99606|nr:hypothetical protein [Flaviramulus sp. BrNp1-15]ULC59435.1 hypothetical protein MBM09_00295 [Flaviramulus sp. BrNp1-15]